MRTGRQSDMPAWAPGEGNRRVFTKGISMQAKDVMTIDVIAVRPDTSVQEVAILLSEKGISGVPVVDNQDRVLGIISRANLVRALAATKPAMTIDLPDRTIREKLLDELKGKDWTRTTWPSDVIVRDSIVHLWVSEDQPEDQRRALRVAAENFPGVRGIEEHIAPSTEFSAF